MSKSKRIAKNQRKNKGAVQFARTVKKTGKWRGKLSSEYVKYVKKSKKI